MARVFSHLFLSSRKATSSLTAVFFLIVPRHDPQSLSSSPPQLCYVLQESLPPLQVAGCFSRPKKALLLFDRVAAQSAGNFFSPIVVEHCSLWRRAILFLPQCFHLETQRNFDPHAPPHNLDLLYWTEDFHGTFGSPKSSRMSRWHPSARISALPLLLPIPSAKYQRRFNPSLPDCPFHHFHSSRPLPLPAQNAPPSHIIGISFGFCIEFPRNFGPDTPLRAERVDLRGLPGPASVPVILGPSIIPVPPTRFGNAIPGFFPLHFLGLFSTLALLISHCFRTRTLSADIC